jgi:hypothetical protein
MKEIAPRQMVGERIEIHANKKHTAQCVGQIYQEKIKKQRRQIRAKKSFHAMSNIHFNCI